jgi:hypothetical protein
MDLSNLGGMSHAHRVKTESGPLPFLGPVGRRENRRAHGGHRVIQRCACGASREVNRNAGTEERGPWVEGARSRGQGEQEGVEEEGLK